MLCRHSLAIALTAAVSVPAPTAAQPQADKTLSATEVKAVARSLELIRDCQLPDGAIAMTAPKGADGPVWVQPYFACHAALALLAPNPDAKGAAADRERVRKWLAWCVKNQEKGGYWCDRVGTATKYKSNGAVDAHDSSAALFVVVAERYQRAGGTVTDDLRAAVKASLACLDDLTDADGLTWAKPEYKVKFLMDNVEVYAGLSAAARFHAADGQKDEAKKTSVKAATLEKGLLQFWGAKEKGRFAWALHPDGKYDGGLDKLYPHGLAQLFGVTFVRSEVAVFREVTKAFKPEHTPEGTGPERFLLAALRAGDEGERAEWRTATAEAAAEFDASVYVVRPAIVVLAFREGTDWLPSPLAARAK